MKRLILAATFLAIFSANTVVGQGDKKVLSFTSEYLPLKMGNKWVYQTADMKEKVVVTVDRMEPKKRTLQSAAGDKTDTVETYFLRFTKGDLETQEQLMISEDGIYRVAAGGKEIRPPIKLLKLPPAKGDSWRCDSTSEATPLKGEMVVDQVTLPGFDGPVFLVKTRDFTLGDQKFESSHWFAKNVGIVKYHQKVGKFDLSCTLDPSESIIGAAVKSAPLDLPKFDLK